MLEYITRRLLPKQRDDKSMVFCLFELPNLFSGQKRKFRDHFGDKTYTDFLNFGDIFETIPIDD